jgi:hypothetical protein
MASWQRPDVGRFFPSRRIAGFYAPRLLLDPRRERDKLALKRANLIAERVDLPRDQRLEPIRDGAAERLAGQAFDAAHG